RRSKIGNRGPDGYRDSRYVHEHLLPTRPGGGMRTTIPRALCLALSLSAVRALAQGAPPDSGFEHTAAMVPMRDGTRLNTVVYTPRHASGPLSIVFLRTPYGVANAPRKFQTQLKELMNDEYIFAFQDIRGRYQSEGKFVMQRALHPASDPRGVDESTD